MGTSRPQSNGDSIVVKNVFSVFYFSIKNMFFNVFYSVYVFFYF